MSDALNEARHKLTFLDGSGTDDYFIAAAQAYAAIAQAENASASAHAHERIAESLERALPMLVNIAMHLSNIHQTLMTPDADREPTFVADHLTRIADALDILAHPNRILAPDPQDYYSEDEYNAAAEKYDYHKNSKPGESVDEFKARRWADYA